MRRTTLFRTLAGALFLTAASATAAAAGGPWISVEYPANPFDQGSRGALMIVRTYHHGVMRDFPVTAHAEGVVNGRRTRIPLEVLAMANSSGWAVRGALPENTVWVIAVNMTDTDTNYRASALAAFSHGDRLVAVQVPKRGGAPRAASADDIEALLAQVNGTVRQAQATSQPRTLAGVGLLALLPIALVAFRRRGRRD